MFKPKIDICHECNQRRLIPTKRGLCQWCERGRKANKNSLLARRKKNDSVVRKRNKMSVNANGFFRAISSKNKPFGTPNNARTVSSSKKPRPSRKQPKATGELKLFKRLYEERGPYSQVAPFEYVAFDVRCFSHLLSKQSYPSLRLEPENIVIKTPKQHDMWHTQYDKLKDLPEWQWVLEKEQKLKQKYYLENKIKKL